MSLGNTLRAAREACGLTTSELAARTHMLVQIVEGLEHEDFRRIPAPIYGRGFIKLYCEAVNLDPKPLQAEFMDLFSRAKDAPPKESMSPVRSRPQTAEPPPPQPMASAPEGEAPATATGLQDVETAGATETPSAETGPVDGSSAGAQPTAILQPKAEPPPAESLFDLPIQTQDPAATVNAQPPPKRSYGDLFGQSYSAKEETPKQSAAEKFRNTMSNVSSGVFANVQRLPPNIGRIVTVSLCAIFILGLIGWGVFELYKATTPGGNADAIPADTAMVEEEKPKMKSDAAESRKENVKKVSERKSSTSVKPGDLKSSGIEVPALYID